MDCVVLKPHLFSLRFSANVRKHAHAPILTALMIMALLVGSTLFFHFVFPTHKFRVNKKIESMTSSLGMVLGFSSSDCGGGVESGSL